MSRVQLTVVLDVLCLARHRHKLGIKLAPACALLLGRSITRLVGRWSAGLGQDESENMNAALALFEKAIIGSQVAVKVMEWAPVDCDQT
jgi:hypothetical protein